MNPTLPAPAYAILFAFTGAAGTVLEIKRTGLPTDAPRSRRYQWLWVAADAVPAQALPLQFVSMQAGECQARVFAEATLRFDARGAELTWQTGTTMALRACPPDALPPAVRAAVAGFLAA